MWVAFLESLTEQTTTHMRVADLDPTALTTLHVDMTKGIEGTNPQVGPSVEGNAY